MANKNNSLWIVLALVAAGVVVFFFSFKESKAPANKVVMQEVFTQKPAAIAETPVKSVVLEKDPVPSPAIVTSPEHGMEAGFAVQVYSFKDQKRADLAVTNLKNNGFKAYMEVSDLGEKGTWYRVRIGGLANEEEAKILLETVRKSFNSGIIIKPKA